MYQYWGCITIYWPLSYPFRSLSCGARRLDVGGQIGKQFKMYVNKQYPKRVILIFTKLLLSLFNFESSAFCVICKSEAVKNKIVRPFIL